jgi:tRNA threonylcarbamoyl adenosine modification protein YeaZ
LLSGSRLVAGTQEDMAKGQAERLMPLIAEVLEAGGAAPRDLDAIGVGIGPGNFTGVRIAVSAARGLALALGIPAVGVSRLEALAFGLPRPLAVVEDARRGEVYVQAFDAPGADAPLLLNLTDLPHVLTSPRVTGSGAALAADAVPGLDVLAPAMPLAEAIARIAAGRWQDADLPRPAPLYLRAADAAPSRDRGPAILPC